MNCRKLLDPGWLDPDIFATIAVRVACLAGLKSIYTVGQGVSSTRGPVKFNDIVDVVPFTRDWDKDPSEWIAVKSTNRHLWKTASPKIHADKVSVRDLTPKVTAKSRRTAIASALSLAMLLGLPACTYANNRCGRLIADTGCGKDMVSETTFTDELLAEHSVQRRHPIRMQTANGIVELTNEITFDIEKLQQSTTAVIGKDTPDLLSVGYRCQELGYGFYWPPHSIPYFVLPDGKTEVDLEVDQFVPYLLDTGDTAVHKPSSSSRCYPVTLSQKSFD